MTTIIFAPIIPPFAIFLAFAISSPIALRLHSIGFLAKSGSLKPICAVDMTPTPPAAAAAPARPDRLTPTPIPP